MSWLLCLVLTFACCLGGATTASAQSGSPLQPQTLPPDASLLPAHVTGPAVVLAPRALFVPAVEWPSELPLPDPPVLEALLIVGKDGRAQLEGCADPPVVCDALAASLLEAEFAPASVAGEARAARVRVRFVVRPGLPSGRSEPARANLQPGTRILGPLPAAAALPSLSQSPRSSSEPWAG